jgi:hypothetical protein
LFDFGYLSATILSLCRTLATIHTTSSLTLTEAFARK